MNVMFFLLLFLVVLPLWLWMVMRIWKLSPPGARITFVLMVPAYFWAYHLWRHKDDALRATAIANIAAFVFLLGVGYKALNTKTKVSPQQAQTRTTAEWVRWCKENNDATYDPVLQTCVENSKEEALARLESRDVFGRLNQHLARNGIKAEIDRSASAAALRPKLITADIARATEFYFLPLSMAQPEITLLLCVSAAACNNYSESALDRGVTQFVRNANMLLILPPIATEDARIVQLKEAFARFKAPQ